MPAKALILNSMRSRRLLAVLLCVIALAFPAAAFADTSFTQLLSQLEQIYQLPTGVLGKIAQLESGGNPNAGNPAHAYGLFQWLPNSWEGASKALFGQPLDPSLRTSPDLSAKVTAFSLADTKSKVGGLITQAGVDMSVGLYLGHFLGISGAQHFLTDYIQNPGGNACALFPRECAANPSILSGRTLAGVINYFAGKMQTAGVPSVAGNFQDQTGVSYAYSSADLTAGNFLPANTPIGVDPQYDYAPVYTSVASTPLTPTNIAGSQLPGAPPQTALPASYTTAPAAASALSAGATASSSSACTPQYSCSNNMVTYVSDSCATSVVQMCTNGCSGTICAPTSSASSSVPNSNTQPTTTTGATSLFGLVGTIENELFATATPIGTTSSLFSNGGMYSIVEDGTATPISSEGDTFVGASGTPEFAEGTLFSSNFSQSEYVSPTSSPLFQILDELKTALTSLLSYL